MKIKKKNVDCYLLLNIICGLKECIDIEMLERFAQKSIPFFMKVRLIKKKKASYTGIHAVSLKEYLKNPIDKFDFYFVLAQFVRLIENAEDNNLPLSHISYDLNNCFLTEKTKELQLLYLPIKHSKNVHLPNDFIEGLVYTAISVDGSDFISDFAFFFRNQNGFNAKEIERFIKNEEPKVYQLLDNKKTAKFSDNDRYTPIETRTKRKPQMKVVNAESDDSTVLGNDFVGSFDEDITLLDEDQTLLGDADDTIIGNECDEQETALLGCESETIIPYIKRISTGEIIRLTKPCFRIGSKETEVDYVIKNNNTVSRSHADFIVDSDGCFVLDLSSKNKTYVNDRVIPTQTRVQIFHEDIIRLSDEEFIFYIE